MAKILDPKREKIATRIQALLNKTVNNGCSEEEAMTAAEMVGKLMKEYDLSMTEIEFKDENFITHEILTESRVASHIHTLLSAIAYFTDTKVWFSRNDVIKYSFFGSEKDTQIADYIYHLISNTIKVEIEKYKKTTAYKSSSINGKTKTTSFAVGMVSRLDTRLRDMKNNVVVESSDCTAIVPINKTAIVTEQFAKLNMRLKTSKASRTVNSNDAYNSGQAAGDKVNITSGLGASNSKKSTLKLN